MQELLLILTTDVYEHRQQTLFVNIICNFIFNTNYIGFYGHRLTQQHNNGKRCKIWKQVSTNVNRHFGTSRVKVRG